MLPLSKLKPTMNRPISTKIFAGLLILLPNIIKAQNNSSPYSVLGIGDIENSSFNRYTGMANAGIALTDTRHINNSNAASLTGLNEHFYSFEISMRYKQSIYTGGNVDASYNKSADFAIRRINLAMKVSKKWGSSVGLQPFSTAAYSYNALKNIQGTLTNVAASYEGEGGVNQFYWANGVKLTKNTSIGLTSSFLFGSLRQTENLLGSDNVTPELTTVQNTYLRNYYFNIGLQTSLQLNKTWDTRYGITFSPKTDLFAEYTTDVTSSDGVSLKNDVTKNDYFTLPAIVNAGIAFIKDAKYTFTINGQYQNWSSLKYQGNNYQLVNSNKLSLGYQNSFKAKNYYNREYEKGFFQLGLYAGQSYLKVKNVPITDIGASIGYGMISKRSPISLLIALEAGKRGTTNKNILSDNYFNLNFTFSYVDFLSNGKRYY
ncbi:membrane protein [soil metagenome]